MSSFDVRHTSEDFPALHPISSGTLGLNWNDLLWAAITIGRPNVTRDVSNLGHFGTGDLEITLSKAEDLERAKPLIELSYGAS